MPDSTKPNAFEEAVARLRQREEAEKRLKSEYVHVQKAIKRLTPVTKVFVRHGNLTMATEYAAANWEALADHSGLNSLMRHLIERKKENAKHVYPSLENLIHFSAGIAAIFEDVTGSIESLNPRIVESLQGYEEMNPEWISLSWNAAFQRFKDRPMSGIQFMFIHAYWSNRHQEWESEHRESQRSSRQQEARDARRRRVTKPLKTRLNYLSTRIEEVTRFIDKYTRELNELRDEQSRIQQDLIRAEDDFEDMIKEEVQKRFIRETPSRI